VRAFGVSCRKHPAALDQLLLERYCGKVGWGLANRLSCQSDDSRRLESLFALGLTSHTEKDESFAETGHNADTNISLY
jgi:hypothetical protein